MAAPLPWDWKFCQVFGEPNKRPIEEVTEVDIVSAVQFDETGEFLAAGDRGGRVVVFERVHSEDTPCEYRFCVEFQSHEQEFDYLKSLEIEEKINKIKFCRAPLQHNSLLLLTTNDKTIKLWKVYDKHVSTQDRDTYIGARADRLTIPSMSAKEVRKTAVSRRIYGNAHTYHINSISLNSDRETFISADDLRINMWHLESSDRSFNIVDIKPANMEELSEVITSAEFHPVNCHQFMYSSSKGAIRFGDMRQSALCDRHAKLFELEEEKSFFSEVIGSISDISFSPDGRRIISRDYMSIKVWDTAMERLPVLTIPLHEYLRPRLCDLYESDCIFDKFELACSGDGTLAVTGTYHNYFLVYDIGDASQTAPTLSCPSVRKKLGGNKTKLESEMVAEEVDVNKKPLHFSWHPKEDIVAIGANNNLYLYASDRPMAQH